MTNANWERNIQVRWSSPLKLRSNRRTVLPVLIGMAGGILALSLMAAPPVNPSAAKQKDLSGVSLLGIAQREYGARQYAWAAEHAKQSIRGVSELEDYGSLVRAQAEYALKNYDDAARAAWHVFDVSPPSPLLGSAAAVAVQAHLDNNDGRKALEYLKRYYKRIPQPQADLALAKCFDATGDAANAAEYYQRVYYNYPVSGEAKQAETALTVLKAKLGDAFPPVMPGQMVGRAMKLFEAKNYEGARKEFVAVLPQLTGEQKDLAQVRMGEADYFRRNYQAALSYLRNLQVTSAEADAERLSYLIRVERRLDKAADVKLGLDTLKRKYPRSPWRLDVLIAVANQATIDNDTATADALFRDCYAAFPKDPQAAYCHWEIAFQAYHRDKAEAGELLRAHVKEFPDSDKTNTALYFLGRLAERGGDFNQARTYYEEVVRIFPNSYYGVIARDRLKLPKMDAASASASVQEFFTTIAFPARVKYDTFLPDKITQRRINRAKLLSSVSLNDWAEMELKYGARNDCQPHVVAIELSKLAMQRDDPAQAIRYIKAFAPNYLYMSLDDAPLPLWQRAFPLPYRSALESYSLKQGLDPFLVAALIRQESEFNEKVVSYANAHGLMQVMPATGRELTRTLRLGRFSRVQLLTANRNLQLGTFYLKKLNDQLSGEWESTLAAYNAGKSRADRWKTWGPFREPAEFIETIPFSQTRGYVQAVLRNADVYRRLYARSEPEAPVYRRASVVTPASKPSTKAVTTKRATAGKASSKKKVAAKRKGRTTSKTKVVSSRTAQKTKVVKTSSKTSAAKKTATTAKARKKSQ